MKKLNQIKDFLNFIVKSTNNHGIHSPYLFNLYNHVIKDDRWFYDFDFLESIRNSYLNNDNKLEIVELGAGSSFGNHKNKSIKTIVKQQLSKSYQLRVLYRLVDWLGSKKIIELGASLGLSSFYLAHANKNAEVISFEGNPYFVDFIEFQKKELGVNNLKLITGNFDETFKAYTRQKNSIDFGFIDGNHREEATVNYFNWSLPCLTENAVLVFDDIHWSEGMRSAWKTIIENPAVTASIDLYFMGIVFFNKDFKEKRHLTIRPKKYF